MGIRGKLLLIAAGIAVPLVLVGVLDLRNMWRLSRTQMDDSVKQQAELASVAFERWLDDQKKALDAIAALAGDHDTRTPTIRENLGNVISFIAGRRKRTTLTAPRPELVSASI